MLNVLIIFQWLLWVGGFFAQGGITLYQVLLIIVPIMFMLRKYGIGVKYGTIIATEVLLAFFHIIFQILFGDIEVARLVVCIILRVICIIICVIDDTLYIYVTEERRKQ